MPFQKTKSILRKERKVETLPLFFVLIGNFIALSHLAWIMGWTKTSKFGSVCQVFHVRKFSCLENLRAKFPQHLSSTFLVLARSRLNLEKSLETFFFFFLLRKLHQLLKKLQELESYVKITVPSMIFMINILGTTKSLFCP